MYVRRGSHTHEMNETKFRFRINPQWADNNILIGYTYLISLEGMLFGTGVSDLAAKQTALIGAYERVDGSFTVLENDGTTEIPAYKIDGSKTIGGIRATTIDFPTGRPGNWTTWLDYLIELEADVGGVGLVGGSGGSQSVLVSWNETITTRGNGGSRFVIREPRNVAPIKQIVSQRTPIFASQRGTAVGLYQYPTAPGPIWPQHLMNPEEELTRESADTVAGTGSQQKQREFRLGWNRQYAASGSLTANPSTGF
jgi:hypothetical protein